jgi:hypothetical protein
LEACAMGKLFLFGLLLSVGMVAYGFYDPAADFGIFVGV